MAGEMWLRLEMASMAVSRMREAPMKSSLKLNHWSAVFSVQYALHSQKAEALNQAASGDVCAQHASTCIYKAGAVNQRAGFKFRPCMLHHPKHMLTVSASSSSCKRLCANEPMGHITSANQPQTLVSFGCPSLVTQPLTSNLNVGTKHTSTGALYWGTQGFAVEWGWGWD